MIEACLESRDMIEFSMRLDFDTLLILAVVETSSLLARPQQPRYYHDSTQKHAPAGEDDHVPESENCICINRSPPR